jgi:hypothetical protein
MRKEEVDLDEAIDMTDLDTEILIRLAADGTLKARMERGQVFFVREKVEDLIDRMIAVARAGDDQFLPSNLSRKSRSEAP